MPDCVFCKIAAGEIPARRAYEDEEAVAFHDLSPQAPVHVLIIPRRHLSNLTAASPGDDPLLGHLVGVARHLAGELGVAESGYRVVINAGPNAGQSVDHLHLHLLAGRPMTWPPG